MSENSYQLQTLSRAMSVLTLIETSSEPLKLKEITDRMGEAGPVIFRILKTLEATGYIRRKENSKKYVVSKAHDRLEIARLLSRAVHELLGHPLQSPTSLAAALGSDVAAVQLVLDIMRDTSLAVISSDGDWSLSPLLPLPIRTQTTAQLLENVRPLMARIFEQTGETVVLFVRSGSLQVALDVLTSHQPLRYAVEMGSIFPINRGAAGKASLAWLEEHEIRAALADPALADEKIDIPALLKDFSQSRTRGYCVSTGERIAGAAAVAVPVWDNVGQIGAVLNVTGPALRCPMSKLAEYGLLLRSELAEIGLLNGEPPVLDHDDNSAKVDR